MSSLDTQTRGRTSRERLRALDAYLCHCEPRCSRAGGRVGARRLSRRGLRRAPVDDAGERRAFRELNPPLHVVGVEPDAARAAAAQAHADALTRFVQGGFERRRRGRARAARARDEPAAQLPRRAGAEAHRELGEALLPGGLLVEGSADPQGGITVAHLLRREPRRACAREALLFHTDFPTASRRCSFATGCRGTCAAACAPGSPSTPSSPPWTAAWPGASPAARREPRTPSGRARSNWPNDPRRQHGRVAARVGATCAGSPAGWRLPVNAGGPAMTRCHFHSGAGNRAGGRVPRRAPGMTGGGVMCGREAILRPTISGGPPKLAEADGST